MSRSVFGVRRFCAAFERLKTHSFITDSPTFHASPHPARDSAADPAHSTTLRDFANLDSRSDDVQADFVSLLRIDF